MSSRRPPVPPPTLTDPELLAACRLVMKGEHHDPHVVLGRHDGVVRAYRPGAQAMRLVLAAEGRAAARRVAMTEVLAGGLFEAPIPAGADDYRLEADYGPLESRTTLSFDDPYRSWPTIGDLDLHLFGEGRHRRLWEMLGAQVRTHGGLSGVSFAVWAPNARAVRVVGDWNLWDGRVHQMRSLGSSGVWELFIPGVRPGAHYKYELVGADGRLYLKADPMAFATQAPPETASVVAGPSEHRWGDESWMQQRAAGDPLARPLSIYEVHLGSWRFAEDGAGGIRPLTYRELAGTLPEYVADRGFTHVELMPVAEHPFGGSWGYQVSAYYAPSARFGTPDDFRALVDAFHRRGIGVYVDWVPAHFPRDEFALARFDGTALYEHEDPRRGEHPDWGTLVFNFGRNEVRNFLTANALYWLAEFHVDGLRVDAVASMLYLDYSRRPGQWLPNELGGRENLEAVSFLREVNELVFGLGTGATTVAEESTSWPGVSRPTYLGGLGFGFKWNMGWMHDTLQYFGVDPLYRSYHQHDLTFGLLYAWHENFVLPLSHDEVVHGKGSLLSKMPGDRWQQLANLRALYAWMWAHPGKQVLFMGGELGQEREWSHDRPLDWWCLEWADHRRLQSLVGELNRLYRAQPALWEQDFGPEGFAWIDTNDAEQSVLSFFRRRVLQGAGQPAAEAPSWPAPSPCRGSGRPAPVVVCVANLTPIPHHRYRVGMPVAGPWREVLNTDDRRWGGSGVVNDGELATEDYRWHGQPWSSELSLPPLGVSWLVPAP